MATPAAVLNILVKANTKPAQMALAKTQTGLKSTAQRIDHLDKRTGKTTKGMKNLAGGVGVLSKGMGKLAGAAGGVAVAYIAIAEAKQAVTVTEDLAKATIGLNKNLGLSVKRASEWASVAKVRGVETKQLNQAFGTLAKNEQAAAGGAEEQAKAFKALGLSQKELKGLNFNQLLFETADGLGKLDAGSQKTSIAMRLFGRGWQTIVPVLRDGSKGMQEQLALARKYGATFSGEGLEGVKNFIAAQREAKFATLGLQVAFGTKLAPVLTKMIPKIAGFLNELRRGDMNFNKIGEGIVKAFTGAMSKLASAAQRLAPTVASGFVKGWYQMNPLAKLFTLAAILRLMGGRGALFRTGAKVGAMFGLGITAGTTTAVTGGAAAGGMIARMGAAVLPFAKRLGLVGVGIALADSVVSEFGRRAAEKGPDMMKALQAAQGPKPLGVDLFGKLDFLPGGMLKDSERAARDVADQIKAMQSNIDSINPSKLAALRDRIRDVSGVTPETRGALQGVVTSFEAATQGIETNLRAMRLSGGADFRGLARMARQNMAAVRAVMDENSVQGQRIVSRSFKTAADSILAAMGRGKISVQQAMKAMREQARIHSDGTRETIKTNYRRAMNAVEAAMERGKLKTKQGSKAMYDLTVQYLKLYGLSPKEAITNLENIPRLKDLSTGNTRGPGARTSQRGGFINQGKPSGDSVPAVLERGEYVLNRKAVAKAGKRQLDAFNYGAAPRFQGGGIVGLGRQLQQQGFQVGEHPAFGGVGGSHVQGSYHYRGQALDVNWPDVGAEPGKLDALYSRLKGMPGIAELLWRVAGHFDHLHVAMTGAGGALPGLSAPKLGRMRVAGVDSILRRITQRGLDLQTGAAQGMLDAAATSLEGAEAGRMGGDAQANMRIGKQLAARYGWGRGPQWGALVELWNRESGWDNMARNPSSGAFGIPQALPPDKMGAAAAGGNAEAQIRWGLNYIAGRYGTPSGALAFHDANNWYQSGGPVGMLFGGGARGRPGSHLTQQMNRAVNVVGGLNKKGKRFPAKVRSRVLKRFLDRIKGIGLPQRLEGNIAKYTDQAAIFGDYATTANTLGTTDAAGNAIPGLYQSMPETHWLTQQLDQMFLLRNALIRAQEIFAEKRQVTKLLFERGHNRMERLFDQVRDTSKVKAGLEKQLTELKKHPVKNADKIKAIKKRMKAIDEAQAVRVRERDTLKNRILPTLKNQRSSLATGMTENLSAIETVQGLGRPMTRMASLPGIGVLGGDILTIQTRLRELGQTPAITDTSSAESSESSELLKELLRQANLRTAVSQAQYAALQSMPFAGSFQTGGVIPGPIGQPQMAVVHGGETVTPVGAAPSVHVSFANGMEWLAQFVDVRVNGQTRKATQRRPLPGRGGGVQRG